jgi:hypothetical protein
MSITSGSLNKTIDSSECQFDLRSWRSLRFLLKAVNEDDASPCEEEIEQTIDIRLTLYPQLPELAFQMPREWLTRPHVPNLQLLDRSNESCLRAVVQTAQEVSYRFSAAILDIELNRPGIVRHYADFSIAAEPERGSVPARP